MKNNRVYITHYASATALGTDRATILDSLNINHPEPVWPGEGSPFLKPYYRIPYEYTEYGDVVRGTAMVLKLLDSAGDFFHANKNLPFFLASSTGGIDATEKVYGQLIRKETQYPLLERHCFNQLPDDLRKRYPDCIKEAMTFSTACSSSGHAILQAYRLINRGVIDKAVVIGFDVMSRTTMAGFDSLQVMSAEQAKPLTNGRQGLTLGEGAGLLVLQSKPDNHASFEIVGAASSTDGYHISSPDPEGVGQKLCIFGAMKQAGITPEKIDYVSAHGTGTVMNDTVEIKVLKDVFGEVPVSSLKSYIGHTLGASTIDEVALCIDMLQNNKIYQPRSFADRMDPMIPECTIEKKVKYFLKNSFGFGGNNVSLVIKNNNF